MSARIEDIEKMSMEEVIKNYDDIARHTSEGVSLWLDIYNFKKNELVIQEQKKLNKQMLLYTKAMTFMTVVVVIATIISLYIPVIK